jgi:hypothetical protein
MKLLIICEAKWYTKPCHHLFVRISPLHYHKFIVFFLEYCMVMLGATANGLFLAGTGCCCSNFILSCDPWARQKLEALYLEKKQGK